MTPHRRRLGIALARASSVLVLMAALAACGDGDAGQPGTSTTSPTSTTVAPASTTVAPASTTIAPATTTIATSVPASSTTTPSATVPVTDSPVSTQPATTAPCPPIGDRSERLAGFPGSLSSLVGVDIRTGTHPCFERIVIEFAPGDAPTPAIVPGYWVRYTDQPITLGETDDQFVELRGDADLLITAEAWMYEVDAQGRPIRYAGNVDLFPTNVRTIEEIRLVENWEGVQEWAVGLDRERDVRVTVLTDPVRLVVDIGT